VTTNSNNATHLRVHAKATIALTPIPALAATQCRNARLCTACRAAHYQSNAKPGSAQPGLTLRGLEAKLGGS
jgi:hypothetical protein